MKCSALFWRRAGLLTIGFTGLGAILCLHPTAARLLEYQHQAIEAGQLWRLITCHWTHWTGSHLAWDLIAYLGLGLTCTRLNARATLTTLALACLVVGAGIWLLHPEMSFYRGLSGLDSALFVLLALQLIGRVPKNRRVLIYTGLAAFLIKTALESATGHTFFASSEGTFTPVPAAHLLGGLSALPPAIFMRKEKSNAQRHAPGKGVTQIPGNVLGAGKQQQLVAQGGTGHKWTATLTMVGKK